MVQIIQLVSMAVLLGAVAVMVSLVVRLLGVIGRLEKRLPALPEENANRRKISGMGGKRRKQIVNLSVADDTQTLKGDM